MEAKQDGNTTPPACADCEVHKLVKEHKGIEAG
jgi:hypothetical protein